VEPAISNQQAQSFVDPAIVSVGKKPAHAPLPDNAISSMPQEAPATPIKPLASATAAPLPTNTSPFVGVAKERHPRKPSAATLAAPFSSIDIADAGEPETDDALAQDPPTKAPKSRAAQLLHDTMNAPKTEDSPAKAEEWKRTRRGGKARKKEVSAQERRAAAAAAAAADLNSSPETFRKG
jgi:enhancer of mRNA-decapping protein 3